jgi:hypothetical protein
MRSPEDRSLFPAVRRPAGRHTRRGRSGTPPNRIIFLPIHHNSSHLSALSCHVSLEPVGLSYLPSPYLLQMRSEIGTGITCSIRISAGSDQEGRPLQSVVRWEAPAPAPARKKLRGPLPFLMDASKIADDAAEGLELLFNGWLLPQRQKTPSYSLPDPQLSAST